MLPSIDGTATAAREVALTGAATTGAAPAPPELPDAPAPGQAAPFRIVRVYRVPANGRADWRAFHPNAVVFEDAAFENAAFEDAFEAEPAEPARYWTPDRIFMTVLIVLMLAAFLAYSFSGLFIGSHTAPPTPPALRPLSLV